MLHEFVHQVEKSVANGIRGIHTALPGRIVSFDPETCTATVQPVVLYRKPDGSQIPYPVVTGVPVVIPQSAGQAVTIAYPIRKGDGCLVVFAEQSLDYWMLDKETSTDLRFDLTNAICIPGLFNRRNAALAKAYETGSVVVSAPSVVVDGSLTVNGDFTVKGGIVNLN